ncbi:MAG: extensin family protein [Hyphomicrobiaceae bacterium]
MIVLPNQSPVRHRRSASAAAAAGIAIFSMASLAHAAKDAKAVAPAAPPPAVAPAAAPTGAAATAATAAAQAAAAAAAEAAQRKIEIDTARARCTALLATINAVTIAKDPIEDGSCGDLAPIELVSVGKNPQVAITPPALLNCDMAVAIHNWVKADIQPLAKKHLGKEIVRLETMSSYSCRNAYGRTMSKLSEHGKANALDIRGFATATGQTAFVLDGWGMTSGEIRAAAAAAEKEQAARLVAEKVQADARARALAAAKPAPAAGQQPNPIANAGTLIDGLPKPAITFGNGAAKPPTDFGLTQPSRLGGPKKPDDKKSADKKADPAAIPSKTAAATPSAHDTATATSLFLRAVHESACKRFSTTLGPETNAAHRNHFHIDLARRNTNKAICE